MKASRFSEEQIIAILREQEAGQRTADVCRRHGVSEATFYKTPPVRLPAPACDVVEGRRGSGQYG